LDNLLTKKYVGSMEQLAYARKVKLEEGKGKNTSIIQVSNGSGLAFTVVTDRGLDIANASIKGVNVSFISKTGITSPALYEEPELGFLRSFTGGLLTTCGMTYYGAPCYDEKALGLHGRMTSIPADQVSISTEWVENEYVIKIQGYIKENSVFGENIVLKREIVTKYGTNEIVVNDTYTNEGFEKAPFMVLYHCNFGYPLLSPMCYVESNSVKTEDRDSDELVTLRDIHSFSEPMDTIDEKVYFHQTKDNNGYSSFSVVNDELKLGVDVSYSNEHLLYLIQWKLMKSGDYVLGMEPATNKTTGRDLARADNELTFINPQEEKKISLKFELFKG